MNNAFPLRVLAPFSHYYALFSSMHFGTYVIVCLVFYVSLENFKFTHKETSPLHGASVYNVISEDP